MPSLEVLPRGSVESYNSENEAELLLGEMRHRMKNNLQAIQSLLRLKKARAKSPEVRSVLTEIEGHINAMNGVQGDLIHSASVRVELGYYLRRLVQRMERALCDDSENEADIQCHFDFVEVPAAVASTIGLIVNEVLTNSFKHALLGEPLRIAVELRRTSFGATLIMGDNGPGYDHLLAKHRGGTLLISRLAAKMDADLICTSGSGGTAYTLHIPLPASLRLA